VVPTSPGASAPSTPPPSEPLAPEVRAALDAAVGAVAARRGAWVGEGVAERLELLERLRRDTWEAAADLVQAAVGAKGILSGGPEEAEEWIGGPYAVLRTLRLLQRAVAEVRRYGAPRLPGRPWTRPDGQVVAPAYPTDVWDRLTLPGYRAEVWMDPAVTREALTDTQAVAYHAKRHGAGPGEVALVLGAGNVSSIGPVDALYQLFVEDRVVVFKTHPVNPWVGDFVERAFAALIAAGYLRVVRGGAAEGAYLSEHPEVAAIHVTGSHRTHDAIVFGTGPEGVSRKAAGAPRNPRVVTSELGNVTPVIVVPGPWSEADLEIQAVNIASGLVHNAGFNCVSHRLVVQRAGWRHRAALLDAIRRRLALVPTRLAYYPGAAERHAAYAAAHPELEELGDPAEGELPWSLIPGIDPHAEADPCLREEAFCGLMAETALAAPDTESFLAEATRFCNEAVWGSLAVTLLVHPGSLEDPAVAAALDEAVAGLRYGTVVINHFPGLAYALCSTPWGAAPGHTPEDIQSGRGVVHNTYMFSRPQKTVVRGPFAPTLSPPWWIGHGRALEMARRLTAFEARPSVTRYLRVARAALRG